MNSIEIDPILIALGLIETESLWLQKLKLQQGLILRRGYVIEYLVVNRIVVKRVLFKWFKLRQVHGPNKLVK